MPHDIWLFDDEAGCLECGAPHFRESQLPGVCVACYQGIEPEYAEIKDDYTDVPETRSFGGDDEGDSPFLARWI